MQTHRSIPTSDLAMTQWMRSADRSWVEEDRAQNNQILRACAVWIIAILSAVFLTVIMCSSAFAASASSLPFPAGNGGWPAMILVSMALVAAASLTAYIIRDTAQRVPARKRRSMLPPG